MISYEEAIRIVLEFAKPLGEECVPIEQALGRTLAESVVAGFDLPRFDQSAVDGYALRSCDLEAASDLNPVALRVVGEVPAGSQDALLRVNQGEAVRIFTGSPIPLGSDAVVMQEEACLNGSGVALRKPVAAGSHVRRRGEEVSEGDRVVAAGCRVTPPVLGVAASLGLQALRCWKQPKVGIVATGSELVSRGESLGASQIYESNALSIEGALRSLGLTDIDSVRLRDDPWEIERAIRDFVTSKDLVLTCGGISVGAHDYVRSAFEASGVQERFWRVAIKPGKPVWFGTTETGCIAFGLPGNPVSALVTFTLFVWPAIIAKSGRDCEGVGRAKLGTSVEKRGEVAEFVRAKLEQRELHCEVLPTLGQGSHMLSGLAAADCLIHLPAGRSSFSVGEVVDVYRFPWGST